MSWRGRTGIKDRIFSSLPYILPLMGVYMLGLIFSLTIYPPLASLLALLYLPLYPVMFLNGYISQFVPFFEMIVFFVLYLLVVRNEKLIHFLRFHTMQALMLSILTSLLIYILQLMGLLRIPDAFSVLGAPVVPGLSAPFLIALLLGAIFLTVVGTSIYSIVQALRGLYAEIPFISEAAYAQTR